MEESRLKELKKQLPESLKASLDYIKRFLDQGRASVMVGAGFSYNAEMDESASMKDWNTLAKEMYKRLYSKEANEKEFAFKTPMRIASQLCSTYGRNSLDELISDSLPDDRIKPGKLHKDLLSLPWRDVFTTNYDTLLERARVDSDRFYSVVTNKELLLYKTPPRIIKLHGSFPDIRPFIITEEDYRTYPSKYPEFVNTVRQALIESVFCLVGFSGDDPNFLSWQGWLHDVMGQSASPAYVITYSHTMHKSEEKLFSSRRMEIINLATIPGISSFQEALDFFVSYLKESKSSKWDPSFSFTSYKIKESADYDAMLETLSSIRKSYPGWLVMPWDLYDRFQDMDTEFPFLGDLMGKIPDDKKIRLLYEIDWRATVSLTYKNIDWYVDVLEKVTNVSLAKVENVILNVNELIQLKISLLSIYRESLKREKFMQLSEELMAHSSLLNEAQMHQFNYEKALYSISRLDYNEALKILKEWEIFSYDYQACLWKVSLLLEFGQDSEARVLLDRVYQYLKRSLYHKSDSPFLNSCQQAFRNMVGFLDMKWHGRSNREDDLNNIMRMMLKKSEEALSLEAGVSNHHSFDIGRKSRTYHGGGRGFDRKFLYSYRYFKVYEKGGFPLGRGLMSINDNQMLKVLPALGNYDLSCAILILIRTSSTQLAENTLSRKNLKELKRDYVGEVFKELFNSWAHSFDNTFIEYRMTKAGITVLSHLVTKCSEESIITLFDYLIQVYKEYPQYRDKVPLGTLYHCLTPESLASHVIPMVFELPIELSRLERDVPLPTYGYRFYAPSNIVIDIIESALNTNNVKIVDAAYERLRRVYYTRDEVAKNRLAAITQKWRQNNPQGREEIRYSFNVVPMAENERALRTEIINHDIQELIGFDEEKGGLEELGGILDHIHPSADQLNEDQIVVVLEKIRNILVKRVEDFVRVERKGVFSGFWEDAKNQSLAMINLLLKRLNLQAVPVPVLSNFYGVVADLCARNVSLLESKVLLNNRIKVEPKPDLHNQIENALFSKEKNQILDSFNAMCAFLKDSKSAKMVHSLMSFIELSQSDTVPDAISTLGKIYESGYVSKGNIPLVARMFSRLLRGIRVFDISEEYKTDIYYAANKLAGALSVRENLEQELQLVVEEWRNYSNDVNIFNDIRVGYEQGRIYGIA